MITVLAPLASWGVGLVARFGLRNILFAVLMIGVAAAGLVAGWKARAAIADAQLARAEAALEAERRAQAEAELAQARRQLAAVEAARVAARRAAQDAEKRAASIRREVAKMQERVRAAENEQRACSLALDEIRRSLGR